MSMIDISRHTDDRSYLFWDLGDELYQALEKHANTLGDVDQFFSDFLGNYMRDEDGEPTAAMEGLVQKLNQVVIDARLVRLRFREEQADRERQIEQLIG